MNTIITSLLDTDQYKFSMAQVVYHFFPGHMVEYAFKCRNKVKWTQDMVDELTRQINLMSGVSLCDIDLGYLSSLRYFKPDFIDFLRHYRMDPRRYVTIKLSNSGELEIRVKGPWLQTIFFEVPVLAIVNEVYYRCASTTDERKAQRRVGLDRLSQKIEKINEYELPVAELGTRRRWSGLWQHDVVGTLAKRCPTFVGTSNVQLAFDFSITAIGTMAHEYIMSGAGCKDTSLVNSQRYMLQKWVDEYRGDLGIALTDTYGVDFFMKDFDLYFAKLYDGVRHDSGCPLKWGEKMMSHYEGLGIDPMTKRFIFSDGLTIESAARIKEHFLGRINMCFGIGTHLTNDMGLEALKIVMKMVMCNGCPTIKLPDSEGKTMCESPSFAIYAPTIFRR